MTDEAIPGMAEDEGAPADEGGTGAGGAVDDAGQNGADGAGEGAGDPGAEGGGNGAGAEGADAIVNHPYVKDLSAKIEDLTQKLAARAEAQPEPAQPGSGAPSPEFLAEMEKDFGFARVKDEGGNEVVTMNQSQFVKGMLQFGRHLMNMSRSYADGLVHTNTSEIRTDSVISDLAQKTPDINRYRSEIKEYLKKRYAPKDQSNADYVMDGYYRAKGMNGGAAPVAGQNRSNVRVLPTPAPSNRGGRPAGKGLGGIARNLISSGTFKDEKEFNAWQNADLNKL